MQKLKEIRKRMGITQKGLGDSLGVAQNTISAWEKGVREPDIESIKRLCEILHTSSDELLDSPMIYEEKTSTKKIDKNSQSFKKYVAALEQLPDEDFQKVTEVTKAMLPQFKELMEELTDNFFEDIFHITNESEHVED